MNAVSDIELRKKLTFKEAEGLVPLPSQLKWGALNKEMRSILWVSFYIELEDAFSSDPTGYHGSTLNNPLRGVLMREHAYRRHEPINTFNYSGIFKSDFVKPYQRLFFNSEPAEVLDFIQFVLRDKSCSKPLKDHWIKDLCDESTPYSVVFDPCTIVPKISEEEAHSISESLNEVSKSKFGGSKSHFSAASAALSDGRNSDAIRESIHAVESAVKVIAGKEQSTLAGALPSLQKLLKLHPALMEAVKKLYNYTSDEKGIRHALIDEGNKNVGQSEAIFMFGACASFVSYLITKSKADTAV